MGDTILITKNLIKKQGVIPSGIKLVDGLEISEAGGIIQRDRMQLATEGICIVTITVSAKNGSLTSKPDIITRGFMSVKNSVGIMDEAKDIVINQVINSNFKTQDWNLIKNGIKKSLQTFFFRKFKVFLCLFAFLFGGELSRICPAAWHFLLHLPRGILPL